MARAARKPRIRYVLVHESYGTYFGGWTADGRYPFFGTAAKAFTFERREDAAVEIGKHWSLGNCSIERQETV